MVLLGFVQLISIEKIIRFGWNYKPEHDKEGWEQYTSGYIWTGQWMDKGEYYPEIL